MALHYPRQPKSLLLLVAQSTRKDDLMHEYLMDVKSRDTGEERGGMRGLV